MRSDSARSAMNAFRTIITRFPKSDILDRAYYITSELRHFQGNIEFVSVGSCVYHEAGKQRTIEFSTHGDGQELYCLLDAGYVPRHFVFSNVAYSIGVTGGLLGGLKSMARGEIKEFSDVFNATRHVALDRLVTEAKAAGGNCVLGIVTRLKRFQGLHEMVMLGTAAHHDALGGLGQSCATSDLTCQETWNMTRMGYAPMRLVLGTAVYSLGMVGGLKAALKSFTRGEISDLTTLIYDAREHAIDIIRREASSICQGSPVRTAASSPESEAAVPEMRASPVRGFSWKGRPRAKLPSKRPV